MQNSYLFLMKISWRFAGEMRQRFVWIYFFFILSNICLTLNPVLYGWFLNSLQTDPMHIFKNAWIYIAGYFILYILNILFHAPSRMQEHKIAFSISTNFLNDVYGRLLDLPVSWHKHHHSGSIINRLKKSHNALRNFFQNGFSYIKTISQFVISFVAILYFSPLFGVIALIIGVFTLWVILLFDEPYVKSLNEINEIDHKASSTLTDSITNILTVITLKLKKQIRHELIRKVGLMLFFYKKSALINEWKWIIAGLLINLIYCIMIIGYIVGNYHAGKQFNIGGLVTIIGFVNQFTNVFYDVAIQYNGVIQFKADVEAAELIINSYNSNAVNSNLHSLPGNWAKISISNLNFSYPERYSSNFAKLSNANISGVNIDLKRGQRIALVGASGSGKSTLLSLLTGLYNPQSFNMVVDNDVNNSWERFTNVVTLCLQEPEIFENTLEYNITLGLSYTKEEISDACSVVNLSEIIDQLPGGLSYSVHENGANLSGGQKQRLGLARGLLASKNSDIVLLDEPTSNLDQSNESKIYTQLFSSYPVKVFISSVHRLYLLPLFDYIYMIENGKIVSEGSFEKLLSEDAFSFSI